MKKYMNKKNLVLLGVLAILLIVTYIYQGPYQDWKKGQDNNFLSEVNIEDLTKIEISKAEATTTIALEKDDQGWKLAGSKEFYIKDNINKDLKQSLEDAKNSEFEIISSNSDNKQEFETGSNGTIVTFYQNGGNSIKFVVGKLGPNFSSSYISRPKIDETYLVNTEFSRVFNNKHWVDSAIFNDDKSEVSRLRFQYPETEFIVEKEGEEWSGTSPYSFNVSQEKIEKILDVMTNLNSADIPAQQFKGTGLEKHLIIVEASGENLNNTLMIGEKNKKDLYYAKKAKSDNIYLVKEEDRNILKQSIEDLR